MFRSLLLACALALPAWAAAPAPLPKGDEVIARAQKRLEKLAEDDASRPPTYSRTNVILQLDDNGKVEKRTEKIYAVQLIRGLPRARVVAVDGRVLSSEEQRTVRAQEERFQRAVAQEKNPDETRPKAWLNDDIRARFLFTTTGRTNFEGRSILMLAFAPRADAPAKTMVDKVINTVHGVVWVDEAEDEIARLDMNMAKSVKFWGGLVGQLDGFDFSILRRRSPEGIWFNRQSFGNIRFRRLFTTMRLQITEHSSELQSR